MNTPFVNPIINLQVWTATPQLQWIYLKQFVTTNLDDIVTKYGKEKSHILSLLRDLRTYGDHVKWTIVKSIIVRSCVQVFDLKCNKSSVIVLLAYYKNFGYTLLRLQKIISLIIFLTSIGVLVMNSRITPGKDWS